MNLNYYFHTDMLENKLKFLVPLSLLYDPKKVQRITISGGGGVTTFIFDKVQMCGPNSPLFQRCQVYDKPPFSKKSI